MTATDPPVASPARRRITFLTTVLTPRRGMENAVLRLATALAERHDVEILVLHDPGPVSVPRVTITMSVTPWAAPNIHSATVAHVASLSTRTV